MSFHQEIVLNEEVKFSLKLWQTYLELSQKLRIKHFIKQIEYQRCSNNLVHCGDSIYDNPIIQYLIVQDQETN